MRTCARGTKSEHVHVHRQAARNCPSVVMEGFLKKLILPSSMGCMKLSHLSLSATLTQDQTNSSHPFLGNPVQDLQGISHARSLALLQDHVICRQLSDANEIAPTSGRPMWYPGRAQGPAPETRMGRRRLVPAGCAIGTNRLCWCLAFWMCSADSSRMVLLYLAYQDSILQHSLDIS